MNVIQDFVTFDEFKKKAEKKTMDENSEFVILLREISRILNELNDTDMLSYIKQNMVEDQVELIRQYDDEFGAIPNDDPLKKEVIEILNKLMIKV
jgi:hypothetical protein